MKQKHFFSRVISTGTIFAICASMMFAVTGCGDKESNTSGDTVSNASTDVSTAKAESTSVAQKSDSPVTKLDDVAFKTKDGKAVTFGMKKADIDKVLGPGKGDYPITYGQLSVQYRTDEVSQVIGISKGSSTDESQYTVKGIKLGDKKADVLKAMGTPPKSLEKGTSSAIQYYFKVDGDKLQKLDTYKDIKDGGEYLSVTFAFAISSNDGITDDSPVAMITEVSISPAMISQLEQQLQ